MKRRGCGAILLLLALLTALGTFAYLTQRPRSPVLDRVARWPPAAPWVEAFRRRFDPPAPASRGRSGSSVEIVELPPAEPVGARPLVWIEPGVVVRSAPEPAAPAVAVVDVIANVAFTERRGDWVRLDHPGRVHDGGWAYLPASSQPGVRSGLEPVHALPAARPHPEVLAAARRVLGDDLFEPGCGPYLLLTDVRDAELVGACELLAEALDAEFEATVGVAVQGDPAGAVLLFADGESYRDFADTHGGVHTGYAGYANAARGYVALTADDVSADWVLKNLVHELTHLVTRRAVGPALPRWLAEGVSDLLGDRATASGFAPLAAIEGSAGEAARLRAAYEAEMVQSLERLVGLGEREFDSERRSFDYEQSAFFVRFLVETDAYRPAFGALLRGLAAGEPYDPDAFVAALGTDWSSLDEELELWVRRRWLPAAT